MFCKQVCILLEYNLLLLKKLYRLPTEHIINDREQKRNKYSRNSKLLRKLKVKKSIKNDIICCHSKKWLTTSNWFTEPLNNENKYFNVKKQ